MFGHKQHGYILLAGIGIGVYKYMFIWRANVARLQHLFGSAHEIKMYVSNKVFLVNHWR